MKIYVVIDDVNGVHGKRAFKTLIEAQSFAFEEVKSGAIESQLDYVTVEEVELEE